MFQPLFDREMRNVLLDRLCRLAGKQRRKLCERVVGADLAIEPAPVIDQVPGNVYLVLVETYQREYLRSIDDRGVHPGLDAIMQKHRVKNDARCRAQTE